MQFYPTLIEDEYQLSDHTKLPLSKVYELGKEFESIASAVHELFSENGKTSGIYKITIPKGTHLAEYKSGVGNLGTVLDSNNQIAGQAVLKPLAFDPVTVLMIAALTNINQKLDAIQELQQDMMNFLVQKEKAELRGNLIFLSDILNNYRLNWNNDLYKNSSHIKVLDIRQTAEQKILFFRDQITTKLNKRSFLHSDRDTQKQIDSIRSDLKEYQLALYTHGFSSFLDIMLVGNFESEYLKGIRKKIEGYSWQYRELYTKCYNQLEDYSETSIQSTLLKGLKSLSKATGSAIARTPAFNKKNVDEALSDASAKLAEAGDRLDKLGTQRTQKQLSKLVARSENCVTPFLENIDMLERLYNNSLSMAFDKDTVYFGVAES